MANNEHWRRHTRSAVVPTEFAAAEEAVFLLAQQIPMDDGVGFALAVDAIFRCDSARIPREDAVGTALGSLRPLIPGIDREIVECCLEEVETVDPAVIEEFDRIRAELLAK